MKIVTHKRLSRALGTIVSRKFGHLPISHKVRGNTGMRTQPGGCHKPALEFDEILKQINKKLVESSQNSSITVQNHF